MAFADVLPKMRPAAGGEVKFCTLRERIPAFFEATAGKILLVSDEAAFPSVAFAARGERTVSVVGGDALPLFAMPEAAGVIAAGGENVLRAARLYAAVKRTPCLLFPADCALDGALEGRGALLRGEIFDHPLADAEVCFDESLLYPTRAEGYARLLLCRLALFERAALFRFDGGAEPDENAFALLMDLGEADLGEIVAKNAALRRAEFREGEGKILAASHGNFAAFEALTALYVAFFRCGMPRKFVVPDYEARAKAAKIPYAKMKIPTEEIYLHRALVLGGRRAEFLRDLALITRKNATYRRVYRSLGGKIGAPPKRFEALPERSNGLTSIIRDFGLMEKL